MLATGTRLGAYEIVSRLGAGGMGEVWRATDTKLGREEALAVLPETFAADPERMARFEREARVLASFNHPNIATLYGLESAPVILTERGAAGPERVEGSPEASETSRSARAPEVSGDPSTRRPDGRLAQDDSGKGVDGRLAQDDSGKGADGRLAQDDSGKGANGRLAQDDSGKGAEADAGAGAVSFLLLELDVVGTLGQR